MTLFTKPLFSVTEGDLQALVDAKVSESKTLEFKLELPTSGDTSLKEFLYDVDSFANVRGGDLIFGIREDGGEATELVGLEIQDIDKEIRRLEQCISSGIEPRIAGLQIRHLPLSSGRTVIIIRVPHGWAAPYMVKKGDSQRFYGRRDRSKYPLDVQEIKSLSISASTIVETIRNFRIDRIAKIASNESPIEMQNKPKIVLHIVPLVSFSTSTTIDLWNLESDPTKFPPIEGRRGWHSYDLDGLTFSAHRNSFSANSNSIIGYTHIFRNGTVEAVDQQLLSDHQVIHAYAFEKAIMEGTYKFMVQQKTEGIDTPTAVMITLLGVKDYHMGITEEIPLSRDHHSIRREDLLIPEVIVDSIGTDLVRAMQPIFDQIWNACSWPRSLTRDEEGNWKGAPLSFQTLN